MSDLERVVFRSRDYAFRHYMMGPLNHSACQRFRDASRYRSARGSAAPNWAKRDRLQRPGPSRRTGNADGGVPRARIAPMVENPAQNEATSRFRLLAMVVRRPCQPVWGSASAQAWAGARRARRGPNQIDDFCAAWEVDVRRPPFRSGQFRVLLTPPSLVVEPDALAICCQDNRRMRRQRYEDALVARQVCELWLGRQQTRRINETVGKLRQSFDADSASERT